MRLSEIFHGVKSGSTEEKLAFWGLCKSAAARHPEGVSIGLTKIAYEIWADGYQQGSGVSLSKAEREAFAGSFGSSVTVEAGIAKMAREGQITGYDQTKLNDWVAESAINDLAELTKTAGPATDFLRRPEVIGGALGTAIGGGVGAWSDPEDRVRGAIAGAVPGGLAGTALGYGYRTHQEALKALADMAAEKKITADALLSEKAKRDAFDLAEADLRAGRAADAFAAALGQVSKRKKSAIPGLTSAAEASLVEHARKGHSGLPADVRAAMASASPDERLAIERFYHQVLLGGQKKKASQQKLADILQGLDEGGQPPMNADGPMGSEEAIGEPDAPDPELEGLTKANKIVDNMIFLANQVNLPQLAQEMDQMREQLAAHFAEGHAYLPAELQHHFAKSEHADAFMKKYKQRFGSPSAVGGKKTAGMFENIHQKIDSLRGLAPGGIDMEELRKYVPDAQYAGMVETSPGKKQPGFVSQQAGMTRTWDPAVARDMRSADPKGFYRTLVGGVFPARPQSILTQGLEAQKTASSQDAWLSWRTHR